MEFAEFLERYAVLLSVIIAGTILLLIIVFLVVPKFTKKPIVEDQTPLFFSALGEQENIETFEIRGTRVTVVLKDKTKLDEERLKKNGVERIIIMEEKIILLVAPVVLEYLKKFL